jgi:hypothetical protein
VLVLHALGGSRASRGEEDGRQLGGTGGCSIQGAAAGAPPPGRAKLIVLDLKAEGGVEERVVNLLNEAILTAFEGSGVFEVFENPGNTLYAAFFTLAGTHLDLSLCLMRTATCPTAQKRR